MVGIDTNVLVRYLAQDDPQQGARATRLIERELTPAAPGFVSLVVLAELCWVLARLDAASGQELRETLADLLAMPQLQVERCEVVQARLRQVTGGADARAGLMDVLIAQLARSASCEKAWTFDKLATRDAGMALPLR